jgi:hypothetical protein
MDHITKKSTKQANNKLVSCSNLHLWEAETKSSAGFTCLLESNSRLPGGPSHGNRMVNTKKREQWRSQIMAQPSINLTHHLASFSTVTCKLRTHRLNLKECKGSKSNEWQKSLKGLESKDCYFKSLLFLTLLIDLL